MEAVSSYYYPMALYDEGMIIHNLQSPQNYEMVSDDSGSPSNNLKACKKVQWTPEETRILEYGINLYGTGEWKKILADEKIAKQLHHSRTEASLKDRYRIVWGSRSALSKSKSVLKKERRKRKTWTPEEDREMLRWFNILGTQWTEIVRSSAHLHKCGRTGTDVRDRIRNKYPELYASYGLSTNNGNRRNSAASALSEISCTNTNISPAVSYQMTPDYSTVGMRRDSSGSCFSGISGISGHSGHSAHGSMSSGGGDSGSGSNTTTPGSSMSMSSGMCDSLGYAMYHDSNAQQFHALQHHPISYDMPVIHEEYFRLLVANANSGAGVPGAMAGAGVATMSPNSEAMAAGAFAYQNQAISPYLNSEWGLATEPLPAGAMHPLQTPQPAQYCHDPSYGQNMLLPGLPTAGDYGYGGNVMLGGHPSGIEILPTPMSRNDAKNPKSPAANSNNTDSAECMNGQKMVDFSSAARDFNEYVVMF